jgi:extracellular factor (EF) 3-hydroxypalmitic acid methyl ester biosynthesis protein
MLLDRQDFNNGHLLLPGGSVLKAAQSFSDFLRETELRLRRAGSPIPSETDKELVAHTFHQLIANIETYVSGCVKADMGETKDKFRRVIVPWLCRSRLWWRALFKPQGYPGDFQMIEWIYDLETSAGSDRTQCALVNCLDYTLSTVSNVESVWNRRRWLTELLRREFNRKARLSVLDIACGGARYIGDFLSSISEPEGVSVTLVDQDAAALTYACDYVLERWRSQLNPINQPIKKLMVDGSIRKYDVIISAGLFDYLGAGIASRLITILLSQLKEGGILALTNFRSGQPSAYCLDWCADWQLIYRDEAAVASLFPLSIVVDISTSTDGGLVYATTK